MTNERATRLVDVPPSQVRLLLLNAQALPDWNPAIRFIDGPAEASTGVRYAIKVRGGLSGTWEYIRIYEQHIDMTWRVPGFLETGTWLLRPDGGGTMVTHEFQHQGPLAHVLSNAFRGVAELRLDRLSQQATQSMK
ncbi:SRPBCC family protein [Micromonospora phytophila]|uniref:SRPBCC family protein n=1 Tax=Micromonospora phytophila TaxID=709888 RepID=UPI00202F6C64|nr:SRPBCC family protein [Micromonospora phytophila]MCM0674848.1 SRPBCC family protein [Micromonospora phytophila]